MATPHWRTGYSVAQLYQAQDANWSFHQLVRLLLPTNTSNEQLLDAIDEHIEFNASMALNLPPGEIRKVTPAANDASLADGSSNNERGEKQKHQIECAHYNLTGIDGPLATPFAEMLREDKLYGEGAMAAFFNLFNNRIHALRYVIHAFNNHSLASSEAGQNFNGQLLLALSGHYYQQQRDFHHQTDDCLIGLSGTLANVRMSLPTVKKLLFTSMGLTLMAMNSLVGRWLKVQSADHTRLGKANHRLGGQATLGTRIWDQQAAFELVIGLLSVEDMADLVPGGKRHLQLKQLIEWISEKRCDCKITLVCEANNQATVLAKSSNVTNRLGFGSALTAKKASEKRISFMLDIV